MSRAERQSWYRRAAPLVLAAASLLLAASIYLGARRGMRIHTWANAWLAPLVRMLRGSIGAMHLPDWVRYSLPDALWQFAFCLVMLWIWRDEPRTRRRLLYCAFPGLFGILVELGQGAGLVQGVFDPMDLFLSVVAVALAVMLVPRGRANDGREGVRSRS